MISWCDPDLISKKEWEAEYAQPIMAGACGVRSCRGRDPPGCLLLPLTSSRCVQPSCRTGRSR